MGDFPKFLDLLTEESVIENSLVWYGIGTSDFETLWLAFASSNYPETFELLYEIGEGILSSSSRDELRLVATGLFFLDVLDSFCFNPAKKPIFFFAGSCVFVFYDESSWSRSSFALSLFSESADSSLGLLGIVCKCVRLLFCSYWNSKNSFSSSCSIYGLRGMMRFSFSLV